MHQIGAENRKSTSARGIKNRRAVFRACGAFSPAGGYYPTNPVPIASPARFLRGVLGVLSDLPAPDFVRRPVLAVFTG